MFQKQILILVLFSSLTIAAAAGNSNRNKFVKARETFRLASDQIDPFIFDGKTIKCTNYDFRYKKNSWSSEYTFINKGDRIILEIENHPFASTYFEHKNGYWFDEGGSLKSYMRVQGNMLIIESNMNWSIAYDFQYPSSDCKNSEDKCFMGPSVINPELFANDYEVCSVNE